MLYRHVPTRYGISKRIGRIMLNYRVVIAAFLALFLVTPIVAIADLKKLPTPSGNFADLKINNEDFTLGPKGAKVVLVEYASLTCPHCAYFHTEVLPSIKKEFIDTGKVRYVYRDFPLDRLALGGAMIARCSGKEKFFGFIETFYKAQSSWSRAAKPAEALAKLSRLGGMGQDKFNSALRNSKLQNDILQQRLQAVNEFGVQTTPTIFVNGARFNGGLTLGQLRTLLENLVSKRSKI